MHTDQDAEAVSITHDAKVAFGLSAAFGIAAAVTVPLLFDSLPAEARVLPLPIPAFSLLLAVQMTVIYGLIALAGLRLARRRGLDPMPIRCGRQRGAALGPRYWSARYLSAFTAGLVMGILLVASVAAIKQLAPGTLPQLLHPPSPAAALAASVTASIGEEILFRLFLLSLLLRLLPPRSWAVGLSVAASSLAFAAAHSPGFVFLYGGLANVPLISWVWLVGLNGAVGAAFAVAYLRGGIPAAILAHLGTDLVWHVASQLAA